MSPPLASVIPGDLHLIQRRMLEQTRHGFEVSSSFLRTLHRAEEVVGRTQETAEAIASANLSLEKHWETYVHLMATTFGQVPAASDSNDGDHAGPAPPS
ncbi:hypothetical protein HPP92_003395 [Vanilla planifolia]|uniref:Phasin domain-containing protein n=1 Tax=Vanilla planifolia TaxID=51239 RepID=A0A835S649_VANPL|nr:hypothetical protein HPP92_003395 [Vanilla planifolia]